MSIQVSQFIPPYSRLLTFCFSSASEGTFHFFTPFFMNSHYGSLSHGRRVIMTRRCFLVEPGIYFSKFLPIDPSSVLGNHVKLSFLLLLHSSLSDPWWPLSFNSPSFSLIFLSPPRLSDHFNVSTTFRSLSSRYSPLIFQTYNSPPKMWCVCVCVCVCVCEVTSVVSDSCATLWTVARQAPLSTGFFRQKYWSGLSLLPPGDLPNQGMKLGSLSLLYWQAVLYHWCHLGSLKIWCL